MKNIKVIFFDLFFTLIAPKYLNARNENDVLGLTIQEWEEYAENDVLYKQRATGQVIIPEKIIDDIFTSMHIKASNDQKSEVLQLRQGRMKKALLDIDNEILDTLHKLKEKGIKICLISNCDIIDVMYWRESPLFELFDDAVFSYEVGYLKPDRYIFEIAIQRMKVNPIECCFIGDGGSNELFGAKQAGMKTVFSEYLEKKSEERRNEIFKYSDFHISDFKELILLFNNN